MSTNYFEVLGTIPYRGRFFGGDSRELQTAPVAVLSYGLWRRVFGRDPKVIRRVLEWRGHALTVVGIAPPGFTGLTIDSPDLWIPIPVAETYEQGSGRDQQRHAYPFQVVARLKEPANPASVITQALSALREASIDARSSAPYVGVLTASIIAARGPDRLMSISTVVLLYALSIIVLVVTCASVTSLLLLRAIHRRRETAVRLAIGMSRRRLLSQLLLESSILARIGGVGGILVGILTAAPLRAFLLPDISWATKAVDARMALSVAVLVVLIGIAVGAIPAVQVTRMDLTSILKDVSGDADPRQFRTRDLLLTIQVALALVLLVAAGLFLRSL